MSGDRVPLEASRQDPPVGLRERTDPPLSAPVEATILVRRRADSAAQERIERILRGEDEPVAREQAGEFLGADPSDVQQVTNFAAASGLMVTQANPEKRTVQVTGTVAQMEATFGVKLRLARTDGDSYLFYEGVVMLPAALAGLIVGILGLDRRPVARHRG